MHARVRYDNEDLSLVHQVCAVQAHLIFERSLANVELLNYVHSKISMKSQHGSNFNLYEILVI